MGGSCAPPPVGGYLELELPRGGSFFHDEALLYQSARAAFRALLQAKSPARVFVPEFICDSMITPLIDEGVSYLRYELDEALYLPKIASLEKDDIILYVNYYGTCQAQVDRVLKSFPSDQVVLDFSQAFFDPPRERALATLYSPRKFFGVPDGGMLISALDVPAPETQDDNSIYRLPHLLKRLYADPEDGYEDYIQAERSLDETTPRAMSDLTRRLIESIDFEWTREQRFANFSYVHTVLGDLNEFSINDSLLTAPLCYPFSRGNARIREQLLRNRVFVPTYWSEAQKHVGAGFYDRNIESLLPLPVDQRYGEEDMDLMISLVQESV